VIRQAVLLLALGWLHQGAHAWLYRASWIAKAHRGHVWNITGAIFGAAVLFMLGLSRRSMAVWVACAILIGHAAQVAGCSAAYLMNPWPVSAGDSLCSDGLAEGALVPLLVSAVQELAARVRALEGA
jgi:hypothetical protein